MKIHNPATPKNQLRLNDDNNPNSTETRDYQIPLRTRKREREGGSVPLIDVKDWIEWRGEEGPESSCWFGEWVVCALFETNLSAM